MYPASTMRVVGRIALLLALMALLAAPAAGAAPALRVLAETPLVLHGRGFLPLERVTVKAYRRDAAPVLRRAVATRQGRFIVRFALPLDPCVGAAMVVAVGSKGSRARLLPSPGTRACALP